MIVVVIQKQFKIDYHSKAITDMKCQYANPQMTSISMWYGFQRPLHQWIICNFNHAIFSQWFNRFRLAPLKCPVRFLCMIFRPIVSRLESIPGCWVFLFVFYRLYCNRWWISAAIVLYLDLLMVKESVGNWSFLHLKKNKIKIDSFMP